MVVPYPSQLFQPSGGAAAKSGAAVRLSDSRDPAAWTTANDDRFSFCTIAKRRKVPIIPARSIPMANRIPTLAKTSISIPSLCNFAPKLSILPCCIKRLLSFATSVHRFSSCSHTNQLRHDLAQCTLRWITECEIHFAKQGIEFFVKRLFRWNGLEDCVLRTQAVLGFFHRFKCSGREESKNRGTKTYHALAGNKYRAAQNIRIYLIDRKS